jgi:hypothetical protein
VERSENDFVINAADGLFQRCQVTTTARVSHNDG